MSEYLWGQPIAFLLLIPWLALLYIYLIKKTDA